MERKICKRCGKIFDDISTYGNDYCWQCSKLVQLESVQKAIRDAEDNESEEDEYIDTSSSDFVICPYCGHAMDVDDPEMFDEEYSIKEDGDHEQVCPECGKRFTFNTYVSYTFETYKDE